MKETFEEYMYRVREYSFADAFFTECNNAKKVALVRGMDPDYLFVDPSMLSNWRPEEYCGLSIWVTPLPGGKKVIAVGVNPKEVEL